MILKCDFFRLVAVAVIVAPTLLHSTERQVVEQIYAEELQTINLNRLMLLELSQYLEEYDLPPFCSLHMT